MIVQREVVSEAKSLFALLKTGHTVEQIRELIAVPPKTREKLLALANSDSDGDWIRSSLDLRDAIGVEFEKRLTK